MHVKRALTFVVTTLTLLTNSALVTAQEAAEAVVTEAPAAEIQGVGTLFLLLGLGAVGLVAVVWLVRERAVSEDNGDAS